MLIRLRLLAPMALCFGLLTAGCGSAPPAPLPKPVEDHTVTVPPNAGVYKVGQPYQIDNVWYYPREQPDYDETGIASWYGPTFYGKRTANGETYDGNQLTAAHRTLPMPVNVRVTNLQNGKSIIVRVNDRGPYARGRIIDLSKRAAELLDVVQTGTARVRVTYLARADMNGGPPPSDTHPKSRAPCRRFPCRPWIKMPWPAFPGCRRRRRRLPSRCPNRSRTNCSPPTTRPCPARKSPRFPCRP